MNKALTNSQEGVLKNGLICSLLEEIGLLPVKLISDSLQTSQLKIMIFE